MLNRIKNRVQCFDLSLLETKRMSRNTFQPILVSECLSFSGMPFSYPILILSCVNNQPVLYVENTFLTLDDIPCFFVASFPTRSGILVTNFRIHIELEKSLKVIGYHVTLLCSHLVLILSILAFGHIPLWLIWCRRHL